MRTKKITSMALLTAIALILFVVESAIPNPFPIPGIKLGLANIVTVFAMMTLGPVPALLILLCRVTLGSIFTGQAITFVYSMSGGILCFLSMLFLRKLVTNKQIWVLSAIGAVFHNIGQIAAAAFLTRAPGLFMYLPILCVSGVCAGIFTGICAQYAVHRLPKG